VEAVAEGLPEFPMGAGSFGSARNDSGSGRFLRNAEVTAESIAGDGGQSFQVRSCG